MKPLWCNLHYWGFFNGTKSVLWATLIWEISIPMTNKTNKLHYLKIDIFGWNFTIMVHVCDFNYIIKVRVNGVFFTLVLSLLQLWNLRYIYVTIWNWTFEICNHNFCCQYLFIFKFLKWNFTYLYVIILVLYDYTYSTF